MRLYSRPLVLKSEGVFAVPAPDAPWQFPVLSLQRRFEGIEIRGLESLQEICHGNLYTMVRHSVRITLNESLP